MIDLRRRNGAPVLRIGHRGAARLGPENTVRAIRAAVESGIDLVEFDVLDLPRGPLVLAHSDRLDEVSHGAASGSVRARSLAELRDVAPELPTLDDALAFFSEEDPACLELAVKVARWTIEHMQDRDGHFYYRRYPGITVKTAMIHWGQATMFKALAQLSSRL